MSRDAELLKALRAAGEDAISGADLSKKLGISRSLITAGIEQLRSEGYEISASPHLGYRLAGEPDVLHADDLLSRLGDVKVIGRDIQVFQETTSTNDVVEKMARDGVKEGAVVFAESQTRGRGRLGRKWSSPKGKGLWFSVLLRPALQPRELTQITVASAAAVRAAIEMQTGLVAEIKWPNDILLGGRKTAGILVELQAELDRVRYLILGIGVDVNLSAADFPAELRKTATSLSIALGKPVHRASLAAEILRALDHNYSRLRAGEFAAIAEEWEKHCCTLGRQVSIHAGTREIRGRAESLGEEGALLVRTEHGHLERVTGGDVTLEK